MILAFLAAAAAAMAPPATAEELRSQIIAADDVLFERAFNQCDLDALHDILTPDAEMVHDQAGVKVPWTPTCWSLASTAAMKLHTCWLPIVLRRRALRS